MVKVPTLFLFDDSSINDVTLNSVERALANVSGDRLYLVLQSYGGNPFTAVRIANILQNKFKIISTIVPNRAMSAATLLALGTDEIFLSEKGMLGPLDLQIEHPQEGTTISALDAQNSITTLSSLSETIAEQRYKFLREKQVGRSQASKMALEVAMEFVKPIVAKIDPYDLQQSYRKLNIALQYANELLRRKMMRTNILQAYRTASRLVNDYPAHEYGIFLQEAKDQLKLNVKPLTSLPEWGTIKGEFEKHENKEWYVHFEEINQPDASPDPLPTAAATKVAIDKVGKAKKVKSLKK